jgi:hypothetical protein
MPKQKLGGGDADRRTQEGDPYEITLLSVYPPIVARQRLGRNVTAVTNTHATVREFLGALFSMWPLSYQGK